MKKNIQNWIFYSPSFSLSPLTRYVFYRARMLCFFRVDYDYYFNNIHFQFIFSSSCCLFAFSRIFYINNCGQKRESKSLKKFYVFSLIGLRKDFRAIFGLPGMRFCGFVRKKSWKAVWNYPKIPPKINMKTPPKRS